MVRVASKQNNTHASSDVGCAFFSCAFFSFSKFSKMPGKKNKQRRNRRRRNRARQALTSNQIILQEAKKADHPLHEFPTALIILLLQWKEEMEGFDARMNNLLGQVHDAYYYQLATAEWLTTPGINHTSGLIVQYCVLDARITRLMGELYADCDALQYMYHHFQIRLELKEDQVKETKEVLACVARQMEVVKTNLFGPFPQELKKVRNSVYCKKKFESYLTTPLVNFTKVIGQWEMSVQDLLGKGKEL